MCRYCGQELVFETKPEPFLIQIPCHRCQYVTVIEASTIALTLHQIYRDHLRGLTPPSLAPSDDGKTVVGYLRVIAIATCERLLAYVTGLVNQELLLQNEYLAAENRILKARLQPGWRLSDGERATLAEIGKRLVPLW
jgi:hypothetical protein